MLQSTADVSTSAIARAGRMTSASLRGGAAALGQTLRRTASAESTYKITAALGELKGVPMKIGQLLSYVDSSLPDDTRATLSALQTHSRPIPLARVVKRLRDELGTAAGPLLDTLDSRPLASASIGQVHRARTPDGSEVVVKVQYPGIAKAIDSDFGPASLASYIAGVVYPALRLPRFVREARARVVDECDYRAEASYQRELAARFADHPVLAIPAVHTAYSTARVLTTTLVTGQHLDDFLATDPGQDARDRVGEALFDFYVGSLLRWGVLSGDPHPGNYLFQPDGRVAIVDHGCTRTLAPDGERLARVTLALEADGPARVSDAIAELGGEALLLLRIRYGLAAVLARLGTRASWRELIMRYGIDPAAPLAGLGTRPATAASAASSPPAAAVSPAPRTALPEAVPPAPPAPLPVVLAVVLVDGGPHMIEIVREVRDAVGLGIREAKQLIERVPQVVKRTHDRGEAEVLKRRLESSGGVVEIRSEPGTR